MDLPARIGSYEPLIRLASGGMASLYIARHAGAGGFERLVVIKRVHRHLPVSYTHLSFRRGALATIRGVVAATLADWTGRSAGHSCCSRRDGEAAQVRHGLRIERAGERT